MSERERYTVFEEGFEEQTKDFGLTVEQAFERIMERCDYQYHFGRRGDEFVLTAWQRGRPELGNRVVTITERDNNAARRALMLQSFDGRFKAFYAMPDGAFEKHRREALAFAASETEFDEQQAIRDFQRGQHLKVVKE